MAGSYRNNFGGERGIRTLEGLLTRQRGLRNQYVADFARNTNPLRPLKAPIAGSRTRPPRERNGRKTEGGSHPLRRLDGLISA